MSAPDMKRIGELRQGGVSVSALEMKCILTMHLGAVWVSTHEMKRILSQVGSSCTACRGDWRLGLIKQNRSLS